MTKGEAEISAAEKQATSERSKKAARDILLSTGLLFGPLHRFYCWEGVKLTLPTQWRQYDAACFHMLLFALNYVCLVAVKLSKNDLSAGGQLPQLL
eukprot:CAMPEP_0174346158 /NCGR_PEP_ID=MMETSP0811_2-20130205/1780_1 /TAXON_ID=73025 ORGANISM="Eutreptiella gymnastica-like, Strain CCMP1594" /NCGR_SAMPLE_ID=MMETSP0811_2 /ASSEMBLY_ACC=CAM_ASM_000667 /LENGTH=95 /DNA_ID=CAMNT_0015470463 /DNA_START=1039 /DNA_END=1323 /DNA_ORIENTATION=+